MKNFISPNLVEKTAFQTSACIGKELFSVGRQTTTRDMITGAAGYLILNFIEVPISFYYHKAYQIRSLTSVVNLEGAFIPGKILPLF